jgi:hypothetical protein
MIVTVNMSHSSVPWLDREAASPSQGPLHVAGAGQLVGIFDATTLKQSMDDR